MCLPTLQLSYQKKVLVHLGFLGPSQIKGDFWQIALALHAQAHLR